MVNAVGAGLSGHLRDGLRDARWMNSDLWVASIAMGSSLDLGEVALIAAGDREPTRAEYEVLATALNERLDDLGLDHPIHHWDDLPHSWR